MPKTIICCAVTGGGDTVGKNPAVPVTPRQIADSAIDAARAGAAIVHIHVRDPETGRPSMELPHYREVVERIRASGIDVVINLTTGAGGRFMPGDAEPLVAKSGSNLSTPADRIRHVVALKPDICSLDMGSMNMGDYVFVNTKGHLEEMAAGICGAGVKPELEVFEAGHIRLAVNLIERGLLPSPSLFQICLGVPWAQPATPEAMTYMRNLLPPGAIWFAFGIGAQQFPMVAQAQLLGGHVRVGLEDNLYLARSQLAPSNAALVAKAVEIVGILGGEIADAAEARRMLDLAPGA
jgi:uncharacterized protein (DUF849 family)